MRNAEFFQCRRRVGSGIDQAAFGHRVVKRLAEAGLPNFVRDGDVTVADSFINRLGIRRNVLDRAAHAFEDAANDVGHYDLA